MKYKVGDEFRHVDKSIDMCFKITNVGKNGYDIEVDRSLTLTSISERTLDVTLVRMNKGGW